MSGKYHAQITEADGYTFDSKREAARYGELKLLVAAGEITQLEVHPPFPMEVGGLHIANYVADFQYTEKGRVVVEDVKGVRTPVYKLKKKLMLGIYGIEIKEVE